MPITFGRNILELCRHTSSPDKERKLYKYGALLLIGVSFAYEGYHTFILDQFSLLGWGYSVLFLGLWLWRTGYTYTYSLTNDAFTITRTGLGQKMVTRVDLKLMESFTGNYVRSFFRRTAISRYKHLYSSVDPNPERFLVYRKQGKLIGIIFKVDDKFLQQLISLYQDKYLDFTN